MNTLAQSFFRTWRAAVLVLSLAAIAYLLYFHRLGSLLPGYSTPELNAYAASSNWHAIATNPVNAPYKLFLWLLTAASHHGILMGRLVAASFGTLATLTFFIIIRPWYSYRVAFMGTVLFATSAGLLHTARFGSGQILQMGVLAFIAAVLWYRRKRSHRVLIGYAVVALFGLLCYVPGTVWFELFGVILLQKGFRRQLHQMAAVHLIGWGVLFAAIATPLLIASVRMPHLLLAITGLPPTADALSHIPTNFASALMSIGVRSGGNPLFWVGHAPLLNVIELVLGTIGGYFYLYRERSLRTLFLVGSTLISLVLISFGGSVNFVCLVPLLYLFVTSGLDHLLGQWLGVFPRNPIARFTGIGLISIMLFFSVLYQVRSYFVAWPHNADTRQTFRLPQP